MIISPRHIAILSAVVLAHGCAPRAHPEPTTAEPYAEPEREAERFTGIYEAGWELETFRPCGTAEEWWTWSTARIVHDDPRGWGRRLVVVEGEVSAPGRYGHLGRYTRQIVITRVIEVLGDADARCPPVRGNTRTRGSVDPATTAASAGRIERLPASPLGSGRPTGPRAAPAPGGHTDH